MRILLTGSSGWLGRFVRPLLETRGHHVTGLDIAPGPSTDIVGSVADRPLVDRLFAGSAFDGVIHAGGLHKPDIARFPARAFVETNIGGTLNLLEASARTGVRRFVFTSTTSLMISVGIRAGAGDAAAWLDESTGPLAPRNIYGVTKLAAEGLCRIAHAEQHLPVIVLRIGRFFPEDDDTDMTTAGSNLKANELLHRRLTVEDAAAAHVIALEKAEAVGFGLYLVSAATPFAREDASALRRDARAVIARHFPDAAGLYAARGWTLPERIDRVYDASLIERDLGFRCATGFGEMLAALRDDAPLPYAHDPDYCSPLQVAARLPGPAPRP